MAVVVCRLRGRNMHQISNEIRLRVLNTQYMKNSTLVSMVKMEYGWNSSISGLKMTMKSGLEKIVSSDKDLPVRKPQKILIRPSYFSVLSCHIFFKGFTKWRRLRRFIPFSKFVLFVMLFFIFSEVLRNEDGNIGGPCQGEMKAHRLMLMEDHAISPELVVKCGTDITASCKGFTD